jgi:hypothetical protein
MLRDFENRFPKTAAAWESGKERIKYALTPKSELLAQATGKLDTMSPDEVAEVHREFEHALKQRNTEFKNISSHINYVHRRPGHLHVFPTSAFSSNGIEARMHENHAQDALDAIKAIEGSPLYTHISARMENLEVDDQTRQNQQPQDKQRLWRVGVFSGCRTERQVLKAFHDRWVKPQKRLSSPLIL